MSLLLIAAGTGPRTLDISDSIELSGQLTLEANYRKLEERLQTRALEQACGTEIGNEGRLTLDEVQRRFIQVTRVSTRGRVLRRNWLQAPALLPDGKRVSGALRFEVACVEPRPPAFSLTLGFADVPAGDLEPRLFKVGDELALTCRASTAARAMLFGLGADHQVIQLAPSPLLPALDLPKDTIVEVPGPQASYQLILADPPSPGLHLEAVKLVAFKGDVLPPPPVTPRKIGVITPEAFERWLLGTPSEVREEATLVYRLGK